MQSSTAESRTVSQIGLIFQMVAIGKRNYALFRAICALRDWLPVFCNLPILTICLSQFVMVFTVICCDILTIIVMYFMVWYQTFVYKELNV